jgi:hypothetical protein
MLTVKRLFYFQQNTPGMAIDLDFALRWEEDKIAGLQRAAARAGRSGYID